MRSISDPGLHSASLSPQCMSSGGDSGVDSYCDPMSDMPSMAISLCGGLTDNKEITKGMLSQVTKQLHETLQNLIVVCLPLFLLEQFCDKIVSYQQFAENPSIIDDPNLVVKIGSK